MAATEHPNPGDLDLDDFADALVDHAERTAPRNDDIALLLVRPHDRP
jgi:hypothetical protein